MKEELTIIEVREEQQYDTEKSERQGVLEKHTSIIVEEVDEEVVPHLHAKTYVTVFAVALISFAQIINIVGAGSLTSDFENVLGDSSKGIWLSSSITILTVVLSPPVCQAADYWGRRWFLIILTLCGTAGSIIVARASSMNMAIAGQIICGIAFGLQGLTHAVMSEVLPRRYRPLGQAVATVSAGLGGVTSLLLGGALTRNGNHAGFRNYWYTAMALYALAAVLCYILYNPPVRQSQMGLTNAEKLAKLDWIGYILLSSGLVALCMGLSWSQNPYGWTDAHVLATFLIGVALIACLALYATKFKKDGMFHHGLFSRGWNFVIALACLVVDGLAFFAMNIYFCSEVGTFYESDTLITGFRYSIAFIMSGSVSFLAGAFCSSNKSLRFPTAFAFGLMTIFFICMATATQGSSKPVWAYPIIFGAGFGVTLCTILAIGQLSTPKELLTIATGVMISLRSFGGTIGLAVYNSIYTAKLDANTTPKITEAVLPLGLPNSSLPAIIEGLKANNTTALSRVPGATPEIIAAGLAGLRDAQVLAFRVVWISAGCFTAAAAICALFLTDPTKEFTMSIDEPAEEYEDLFA